MRAAVYRRFGGPEVVHIEELPTPTARRDELLVRVMASTVSAADTRSRSKRVPKGLSLLSSLTLGFAFPRRRVLGMDISGVVEAVGADVTGFRPGDNIIAMLGPRFGGHAEYALVTTNTPIAAKPANLTFEEAAALVFGGITAQAFLSTVGSVKEAAVLIIGASGAVGTAAVQLASSAGGRVTAVCSTRNVGLVRELGAERAIDYTETDITREQTSYDVIVDCVGHASFESLERRIRPGGALLSIVTDLTGITSARGRQRRTGKRITTSAPFTSAHLATIAAIASNGAFKPVIDRTYDLADITSAHRYVDSGTKKGNVVVRIGRPDIAANIFEK